MWALRVCLALACLALGLTALAESASAGTRPTASVTATTNAPAARGPVMVHEPTVLPHEIDEDPHKELTEPPAAPTGLMAEPGRVEGEVKLSWDAPAPPTTSITTTTVTTLEDPGAPGSRFPPAVPLPTAVAM